MEPSQRSLLKISRKKNCHSRLPYEIYGSRGNPFQQIIPLSVHIIHFQTFVNSCLRMKIGVCWPEIFRYKQLWDLCPLCGDHCGPLRLWYAKNDSLYQGATGAVLLLSGGHISALSSNGGREKAYGDNMSDAMRITLWWHSHGAVVNDKACRSASLCVHNRPMDLLFLCTHTPRKCFDRFRWFKNIRNAFEIDEAQALNKIGRVQVGVLCPPKYFQNYSYIYWRVFVGSGGSYPPKYILPKIWKLCRRQAIRLCLVGMNTLHCRAYFDW